MSRQSVLQTWYESPHNGGFSSPTSLMGEAFKDAKRKFESDFTQDHEKVQFASSKNTLEDVQDAVSESMAKYHSQRKGSKARKWLERLSLRIHFYGTILNVLAQHHPEYTALAWGSIRFLIVSVINHENVIATLAKAMAQIADILPRVELQTLLYPTDRMKAAIADLYAHILRFLIRARDWYEEGKLHHFIHSITRPAELRYNDLLEQISYSSRNIHELAGSGQQAELRDMHAKINETNAMVERISKTVALNSSALIDTNHRLSDLQFSQIMASLLDIPIWEPMKVYQYHYSLRRQRCHTTATHSVSDSFWKSPKLRHWSSTDESTQSLITGNFHSRPLIRNLCVDIIEQLRDSKLPVLMAMKVPQEKTTAATISSTDLLKYLVRQAVQTAHKFQTEKSMAATCATFHHASTEVEWFQLLEAVVADMGSPVYIVIDLELLDKKHSSVDGFSWLSAFESYFSKLNDRGLSTKVKVLFVSYGLLPFELSDADRSNYAISAKTQLTTARRRKTGRGSKSPQIPFRLKNLRSPANGSPRQSR